MIVALLFYNDEVRFAAMTVAENNAMVERHILFNTTVVAPRALLMANRALQPTFTARTVWPTSSGAKVLDGPFQPSRLTLSGFYLIDCEDLEDATALAAQYPMPEGMGCIEVRPALQGWDYAPSIDLDATRPESAWDVYADVPAWGSWMPGVLAAELPHPAKHDATGTLQLAGQPKAALSVTAFQPYRRLAVELWFPEADAPLGLEFLVDPLPRNSVRLTHKAVVPRALLDTLGAEFSGQLNQNLRAGVRAAAGRIRKAHLQTA